MKKVEISGSCTKVLRSNEMSENQADDEGGLVMKKFWEWLVEKEYAMIIKGHGKPMLSLQDVINPPPQMLIGYMMEYLEEKGITWQDNFCWNDFFSTEERYEWLKSKIKEVTK